MKHFGKHSRVLRTVPALLLALLLCACGTAKVDPAAPASAGLTLPEIGIRDIDPGADITAVPGSTSVPVQTDVPHTPEEAVPSGAESTEQTETPAATLPPATTEAPTAPPATTAAPTQPPASDGVRVWMGDSRFVGIQKTVDTDPEKDEFISGWGQGYNWMVYTAFPAFDALVARKHVDMVFWSLGANDITNEPSDQNFAIAEKYIEQIKKLMEKYPDITFYLLSYGPVGPEGMDPNNIPDCDAYNQALRIFTNYIFSHTDMKYIDQGEYIERTGFKVTDGCHYDAATNKRAYEYVLSKIR